MFCDMHELITDTLAPKISVIAINVTLFARLSYTSTIRYEKDTNIT